MIKTKYPEINQMLDSAAFDEETSGWMALEAKRKLRQAMIDLRSNTRLTMRSFGELGGVSKAYIYSLERGDRPWSQALVEKICQSLNP